jgi:hypothetical protein
MLFSPNIRINSILLNFILFDLFQKQFHNIIVTQS